MNHNDNINQSHQADQTEAYSGSEKQVTLCATTPKQCKMQAPTTGRKLALLAEHCTTKKYATDRHDSQKCV
jgi:hypothetical protein